MSLELRKEVNSKHWEKLMNTLALEVDVGDLPWIGGDLDIKKFVEIYKRGLHSFSNVNSDLD